MKIIDLHIENIRGIKEIDLSPKGESFVVFGPNGTGKSAVVDALDFLFTGTISRLSGEGTSGISVKKHGCHVDSKPKDTIVRAVIKFPNSKDEVEIERSISAPDNIRILRGDKNNLDEFLDVAKKGQHVLSRRDILRYVTAKKGERAEEIQNLLNLTRVENLRKLFVKVENESLKNHESADKQLIGAIKSVCILLELEKYQEEEALVKINTLRKLLNGDTIDIIEKESIKAGLNPPEKAFQEGIVNPNLNLLNSLIVSVLRILKNDSKLVRDKEKIFVSEIRKLMEDIKLAKELKTYQLLQMGVSLLDETGICPLCEAEWNPEELRQKLEDRLTTAGKSDEIQKRILETRTLIEKKYMICKLL